MPGLVVILTQPNQPGLAERLDRMLLPLTYADYSVSRVVLPALGIAAGRTGPARCATPQPWIEPLERPAIQGLGAGEDADVGLRYSASAGSWVGEAAGGQIVALLEGELPDARHLAGRLGLAAGASQPDVLAALFAREGAGALEHLNGHWAAVSH